MFGKLLVKVIEALLDRWSTECKKSVQSRDRTWDRLRVRQT